MQDFAFVLVLHTLTLLSFPLTTFDLHRRAHNLFRPKKRKEQAGLAILCCNIKWKNLHSEVQLSEDTAVAWLCVIIEWRKPKPKSENVACTKCFLSIWSKGSCWFMHWAHWVAAISHLNNKTKQNKKTILTIAAVDVLIFFPQTSTAAATCWPTSWKQGWSYKMF